MPGGPGGPQMHNAMMQRPPPGFGPPGPLPNANMGMPMNGMHPSYLSRFIKKGILFTARRLIYSSIDTRWRKYTKVPQERWS